MLKFQIKNYDEFRQIFGTRRSAIGTIRNKVLLDFWKSQFMLENFEDNKKYILDNKKIIKEYYDAKIKKDGEIVCDRISVFWNCYK